MAVAVAAAAAAKVRIFRSVAPCVNPACVCEASWNGEEGKYCCKQCNDGTPCTGGAANSCSTPDSLASMRAPDVAYALELSATDPEFVTLQNHIATKWDPKTGKQLVQPAIKSIWKVEPTHALQHRYFKTCRSIGQCRLHPGGFAKNPGHQLRRFHGTVMNCRATFNGRFCVDPTCATCRIASDGFDISKLGAAHGSVLGAAHFGEGHYTAAKPSTAYGYCDDKVGGKLIGGAVSGGGILVCQVAVGHAECIADVAVGMKHQHPFGKHHSRIIDKKTGVDECVVPTDEQLIVTHIVNFK